MQLLKFPCRSWSALATAHCISIRFAQEQLLFQVSSAHALSWIRLQLFVRRQDLSFQLWSDSDFVGPRISHICNILIIFIINSSYIKFTIVSHISMKKCVFACPLFGRVIPVFSEGLFKRVRGKQRDDENIVGPPDRSFVVVALPYFRASEFPRILGTGTCHIS